jgi:PPOX class probable FMN-dependent enzyme
MMPSSDEVTPVTSSEQLRVALGGPSLSTGVNTIRASLDPVDVEWLKACGLWFIATSGADGSCDCSLRGDQPGAVLVLDDTTLALPERAGNRRGDGYRNIIENGEAGLLFVIPGRTDTLRVNGGALLVSDAPWMGRLAVDGETPPLAVVVDVAEVFYHCVKGLRRAGVWDPDLWIPDAAPSRRRVADELTGRLNAR